MSAALAAVSRTAQKEEVRLAVFADVYADADALDAALAEARRSGVDLICILGNLIGRGPDPLEVVQRVQRDVLLCLSGPWEHTLAEAPQASKKRAAWAEFVSDVLADEAPRIAHLPSERIVVVDGWRIQLSSDGAGAATGIDVFATRGPPRLVWDGGRLSLSPGRIARGQRDDPRGSFALLDLGATPKGRLVRFARPVARTAQRLARPDPARPAAASLARKLIRAGDALPPPAAGSAGPELCIRLLAPLIEPVFAVPDPAPEEAFDWVHDVRVGTRRLREALNLLAPVLGRQGPTKRVREFTRALGRCRTLDVAIEHAALLPNPLQSALIDLLDEQRREASEALFSEFDGPRRVTDGARLLELAMAPRGEYSAFVSIGTRHLAQLLEALWPSADALQSPLASEAQHELRKHLKRVRYCLEMLAPLELPALDPDTVLTLKKAQDSLGELHDLDELAALLDDDQLAERSDPASRRAAKAQIIRARGPRLESARDTFASAERALRRLAAALPAATQARYPPAEDR